MAMCPPLQGSWQEAERATTRIGLAYFRPFLVKPSNIFHWYNTSKHRKMLMCLAFPKDGTTHGTLDFFAQ